MPAFEGSVDLQRPGEVSAYLPEIVCVHWVGGLPVGGEAGIIQDQYLQLIALSTTTAHRDGRAQIVL